VNSLLIVKWVIIIGGPSAALHIFKKYGAWWGSIFFVATTIPLLDAYIAAYQKLWEYLKEYPGPTLFAVLLPIVFFSRYFRNKDSDGDLLQAPTRELSLPLGKLPTTPQLPHRLPTATVAICGLFILVTVGVTIATWETTSRLPEKTAAIPLSNQDTVPPPQAAPVQPDRQAGVSPSEQADKLGPWGIRDRLPLPAIRVEDIPLLNVLDYLVQPHCRMYQGRSRRSIPQIRCD